MTAANGEMESCCDADDTSKEEEKVADGRDVPVTCSRMHERTVTYRRYVREVICEDMPDFDHEQVSSERPEHTQKAVVASQTWPTVTGSTCRDAADTGLSSSSNNVYQLQTETLQRLVDRNEKLLDLNQSLMQEMTSIKSCNSQLQEELQDVRICVDGMKAKLAKMSPARMLSGTKPKRRWTLADVPITSATTSRAATPLSTCSMNSQPKGGARGSRAVSSDRGTHSKIEKDSDGATPPDSHGAYSTKRGLAHQPNAVSGVSKLSWEPRGRDTARPGSGGRNTRSLWSYDSYTSGSCPPAAGTHPRETIDFGPSQMESHGVTFTDTTSYERTTSGSESNKVSLNVASLSTHFPRECGTDLQQDLLAELRNYTSSKQFGSIVSSAAKDRAIDGPQLVFSEHQVYSHASRPASSQNRHNARMFDQKFPTRKDIFKETSRDYSDVRANEHAAKEEKLKSIYLSSAGAKRPSSLLTGKRKAESTDTQRERSLSPTVSRPPSFLPTIGPYDPLVCTPSSDGKSQQDVPGNRPYKVGESLDWEEGGFANENCADEGVSARDSGHNHTAAHHGTRDPPDPSESYLVLCGPNDRPLVGRPPDHAHVSVNGGSLGTYNQAPKKMSKSVQGDWCDPVYLAKFPSGSTQRQELTANISEDSDGTKITAPYDDHEGSSTVSGGSMALSRMHEQRMIDGEPQSEGSQCMFREQAVYHADSGNMVNGFVFVTTNGRGYFLSFVSDSNTSAFFQHNLVDVRLLAATPQNFATWAVAPSGTSTDSSLRTYKVSFNSMEVAQAFRSTVLRLVMLHARASRMKGQSEGLGKDTQDTQTKIQTAVCEAGRQVCGVGHMTGRHVSTETFGSETETNARLSSVACPTDTTSGECLDGISSTANTDTELPASQYPLDTRQPGRLPDEREEEKAGFISTTATVVSRIRRFTTGSTQLDLSEDHRPGAHRRRVNSFGFCTSTAPNCQKEQNEPLEDSKATRLTSNSTESSDRPELKTGTIIGANCRLNTLHQSDFARELDKMTEKLSTEQQREIQTDGGTARFGDCHINNELIETPRYAAERPFVTEPGHKHTNHSVDSSMTPGGSTSYVTDVASTLEDTCEPVVSDQRFRCVFKAACRIAHLGTFKDNSQVWIQKVETGVVKIFELNDPGAYKVVVHHNMMVCATHYITWDMKLHPINQPSPSSKPAPISGSDVCPPSYSSTQSSSKDKSRASPRSKLDSRAQSADSSRSRSPESFGYRGAQEFQRCGSIYHRNCCRSDFGTDMKCKENSTGGGYDTVTGKYGSEGRNSSGKVGQPSADKDRQHRIQKTCHKHCVVTDDSCHPRTHSDCYTLDFKLGDVTVQQSPPKYRQQSADKDSSSGGFDHDGRSGSGQNSDISCASLAGLGPGWTYAALDFTSTQPRFQRLVIAFDSLQLAAQFKTVFEWCRSKARNASRPLGVRGNGYGTDKQTAKPAKRRNTDPNHCGSRSQPSYRSGESSRPGTVPTSQDTLDNNSSAKVCHPLAQECVMSDTHVLPHDALHAVREDVNGRSNSMRHEVNQNNVSQYRSTQTGTIGLPNVDQSVTGRLDCFESSDPRNSRQNEWPVADDHSCMKKAPVYKEGKDELKIGETTQIEADSSVRTRGTYPFVAFISQPSGMPIMSPDDLARHATDLVTELKRLCVVSDRVTGVRAATDRDTSKEHRGQPHRSSMAGSDRSASPYKRVHDEHTVDFSLDTHTPRKDGSRQWARVVSSQSVGTGTDRDTFSQSGRLKWRTAQQFHSGERIQSATVLDHETTRHAARGRTTTSDDRDDKEYGHGHVAQTTSERFWPAYDSVSRTRYHVVSRDNHNVNAATVQLKTFVGENPNPVYMASVPKGKRKQGCETQDEHGQQNTVTQRHPPSFYPGETSLHTGSVEHDTLSTSDLPESLGNTRTKKNISSRSDGLNRKRQDLKNRHSSKSDVSGDYPGHIGTNSAPDGISGLSDRLDDGSVNGAQLRTQTQKANENHKHRPTYIPVNAHKNASPRQNPSDLLCQTPSDHDTIDTVSSRTRSDWDTESSHTKTDRGLGLICCPSTAQKKVSWSDIADQTGNCKPSFSTSQQIDFHSLSRTEIDVLVNNAGEAYTKSHELNRIGSLFRFATRTRSESKAGSYASKEPLHVNLNSDKTPEKDTFKKNLYKADADWHLADKVPVMDACNSLVRIMRREDTPGGNGHARLVVTRREDQLVICDRRVDGSLTVLAPESQEKSGRSVRIGMSARDAAGERHNVVLWLRFKSRKMAAQFVTTLQETQAKASDYGFCQ